MKSVLKLIRRFVGIIFLSSLLLFVLNIALLAAFTFHQMPNGSPWTTANETAASLSLRDGTYFLPEESALALKADGVWAILIHSDTGQVLWHTDNLPSGVPLSYSAPDIAELTRGYIDDYPTFPARAETGLVVLGYPKESFWKHMWPSWDYGLIAGLPKIIVSVLVINLTLIFLIYITANSRLLQSVRPILGGIQSLPEKEPVHLREKGLLSELAASINKTSEILQSQNRQLRRKESARADWIAGVSHDIRTPLSMVMGYAFSLQNDARLAEDARRKASVIVKQSERIRDLINNLNLASRLEYDMQPLHPSRQNLVSLVRQVVVDFINIDMEEKYPIHWLAPESLTACFAEVDRELIRRAVGNLLQNCISHNEQGCHIFVELAIEDKECVITVEDDGVGASPEQIERLNSAPRSMACGENPVRGGSCGNASPHSTSCGESPVQDGSCGNASPHSTSCGENATAQRHGLGLLLVRQIMAAHGGQMQIMHSSRGGFCVRLVLPVCS